MVSTILRESGFEVIERSHMNANIHHEMKLLNPDVIIIDVDSPDRDTLENLVAMNANDPKPVVLFSHDENADRIRASIHAGVSAYVVGNPSGVRIRSIVDTAMAQFEEFDRLKRELKKKTQQLEDGKVVQHAKSILMKQRRCSESEAHQSLQKMAMDRNLSLGDAAKQIVAVADILGK